VLPDVMGGARHGAWVRDGSHQIFHVLNHYPDHRLARGYGYHRRGSRIVMTSRLERELLLLSIFHRPWPRPPNCSS
jgi:hypothetical protein